MVLTKPAKEIKNYVNHFTVQFLEDSVIIGKATVPLGQICVDMLDTDDALLLDIRAKAKELQAFADEKVLNPDFPIDVALAIELKLVFNALIKQIIKLPLYEHLGIEIFSGQNVLAGKIEVEALKKMAEPGTKENYQFTEFIKDCLLIPADIHCFQTICGFAADYFFEKIHKRNAEAYAHQLYSFWTDEQVRQAFENLPADEMLARWNMPVFVSYACTHHPKKKSYCVVEHMKFESCLSFLKTDFHKTLMAGRAPRRCQNCGKFFLLENGYDIKYCGRIAPGETSRTCRVVGAHNKASRQAEKTPIQNEYQRTYDRLKKRKANGKISIEEWNQQVVYIQAVKDKVETGQMNEFEGMRKLQER